MACTWRGCKPLSRLSGLLIPESVLTRFSSRQHCSRDEQAEGTTRYLLRGRQTQQLRHEYVSGTGSSLVSLEVLRLKVQIAMTTSADRALWKRLDEAHVCRNGLVLAGECAQDADTCGLRSRFARRCRPSKCRWIQPHAASHRPFTVSFQQVEDPAAHQLPSLCLNICTATNALSA